MIGRFSKLGVYRELLRSGDFVRTLAAGALALASYVWDRHSGAATPIGMVLALLSITINGVPIIWGAVTGVLQRKVNVDELVSSHHRQPASRRV
jgi:Cd2+/Zn2+-exporting ATPase